ncbi:MAG: hypothetical protein ACJAQ7_001579, partial [Sediminicola sp.]
QQPFGTRLGIIGLNGRFRKHIRYTTQHQHQGAIQKRRGQLQIGEPILPSTTNNIGTGPTSKTHD